MGNVRVRWPWKKEGRRLFRSYELAVIDAVKDAIGADAAALLERQITAIKHISRYIDDSYVDLYPRRRGPQVSDTSIAFANRRLDLRIATVRVLGPRGTAKVAVVAVDGHLFELYFSPSPKRLGSRDEIRTTGVTVHANLMQPTSVGHHRVESLHLALRVELEAVWRNRPNWASAVAEPEELYSVHVGDSELLVLAQLPDTTFVAGHVDPPRPGVTRFEPEGDLLAVYATLREAVAAGDIRAR